MKKQVLLALLLQLSFSALFSQFRAGSTTPPDFDAQQAVGMYHYDMDKVQRRLKLAEPQLEPVMKLVDTFNSEMDIIALYHAETFQKRNQDFDNSLKKAMRRRDPSEMEGFKERTKEILAPIAAVVKTKEEDLNDGLREVLDESQFEKWLKYQRRVQPKSQFN